MHADVLIIGAGPSGGAAALRLAQHGVKVMCLERGQWPDRLQYRGGKPDWELTAMKKWSWDPNVRAGSADYRLDLAQCETRIANYNGVGGGTNLFNAVWPRLTPNNFTSRTVAGYGQDWPIDYAELLPYYERTDREVGVSGLGGDPTYPLGEDPPLPPLRIRAGGMRVAQAHARLGWHWWPAPNAIVSAPFEGRHQCVARGTCMTGCGEGAKGSADLAYWRRVEQLGGQVITGARVSRIVLDDNGRAAGAEWFDDRGVGHLQTADIVLSGANGIGTPRLLLASADQRFPEGLANGSGLVGKNLMLHHYVYAVGAFDEQLDTWFGHAGAWIASFQFYESDPTHGAPGSSMWTIGGPGVGPLGTTVRLGDQGWGEQHHTALAASLGHTLSWSACVEDIAVESNRVELSATETDSAGVPIPKLHYVVPEQARTLGRWQQERAAESLRAAGAATVSTPLTQTVSGHLMGTARMGDDPTTSVVDRYGMAHEIPNLGIIDASVFVTSGGVNPTTTICALASRTADWLLGNRSRIARPELSTSIAAPTRSVAPVVEPATSEPVELTAEHRSRLAVLAELLIPPVADRPSTRDVGVSGPLARAVLKARPDLGIPLLRALSVSGEPTEVLAQLKEQDPEGRSALELVVAGGYYMSPETQTAIGYPGQLARPSEPDRYPEYVEQGLLDHMFSNV